MYHSRKIGVFISHIMGYYQKNVCQGIIDAALEYGYKAEIFTSLDGENLGEYGIGEASILHIPDFSDYSGIIFASETYQLPGLKEQILATLKEKCTCPVIEIATANPHFPSVTLENCSPAEQLTTHLIQSHHAKRICYLGCETERYFSGLREHFYRTAMEHAGLTVGDTDVFYCGYSESDVKAALTHFQKCGSNPDAVVCYNDRMALLFMMAAKRAGLRIPEDIAVTGFDNTEDGANATPPLTTVSFPVYELGVCSVRTLFHLIHNENVPAAAKVTAAPIYASSCGCHNAVSADSLFFQQALNQRIASIESSILTSMQMSAALQRIKDLDDGMNLLESYIQHIEHCSEFYLCLYSNWNSVSSRIRELTNQEPDTLEDSGEILLKLAIRDGRRLPECSFKRKNGHPLLPEHIYNASDSAYIYTPLFFEDREFGYVALAYEHNKINYHFQLVHWFMNINQMLQSICDANCTSLLVHHLENVYTKDALTGLYNKHGYLEHASRLLEHALAESKPITCFLFDLDGLKQINDSFGHAEGDFAIQVIGQALSRTIRDEDICARFSGDEFYLFTAGYTKKDAEDLPVRVQTYLTHYNRLSKKGYTISASAGYAFAPAGACRSLTDIEALFAEADAQMYLQKKEHYRH